MHRDYLGDAKDFAKAAIFRLLRGEEEDTQPDLLGRLLVFPMVSDDECLKDEGFLETYRSILGGNLVELLGIDRLWGGTDENRSYQLNMADLRLASPDEQHTVFLDPNTGVMEEDDSEAGRGRIRKRDLVCLFENHADRVIIVFDDSYSFGGGAELGHGEEARRLEVLRAAMRKKFDVLADLLVCKSLHAFGYTGTSVNLMFFGTALASERLNRIRCRLEWFLGSAADRRIVPWDERS